METKSIRRSKKYMVVHALSTTELEDRVTQLLNTGWLLQGGMGGIVNNNLPSFFQAMHTEIVTYEPFEGLKNKQ